MYLRCLDLCGDLSQILFTFVCFSRDVLKWLFSAIKKSTEQGETTEAAKERDEQIRLIAFLKRMDFKQTVATGMPLNLV